jgi:hypothetical protein
MLYEDVGRFCAGRSLIAREIRIEYVGVVYLGPLSMSIRFIRG